MTEITQTDRDAAGQLWRDLDMGDIGPGDGLASIVLETMARAFARERKTAASIPGGMVAWAGGVGAPDDWDGEAVHCRDGSTFRNALRRQDHRWQHLGWGSDIVAYSSASAEAGNCDLGAGECRGHSIGQSWEPEPGSRLFDTPSIPANSEGLVEAGRFLLDRLVDHEVRMSSDDDAREWYGHVTPAMARFRAALSTQQAPARAEG